MTPAPPATSTATARRAVPTPGSTTASTTPAGTYWMQRASASEPARMSWGGISWVRSMTVDVRGEVPDDRLDDADELVGRAVVGQEADRVEAGTIGPGHRAHPNDAVHRWNGWTTVVHFDVPEGE